MNVWDILNHWSTRLGLGTIIVALLGWAWKIFVAGPAKRGQQLVDEARPELRPDHSVGGRTAVALHLVNGGKDLARNVTVGFSGVPEVVRGGDVLHGQGRTMPSLSIASAPLLMRPDVEAAEIRVHYEDRYGTPSSLKIPVSRQRRDDGGYDPDIQWREAKTQHAKPGWRTLIKIGREH